MEVLMCDDDEFSIDINRAYVKQFFRENNITAHIQSFLHSGEQLKSYARQKIIDIAILDIDMGNGQDGIGLARYLKKLNSSIIIIFVTDHKELSFEAFDVAAFALIPKPLNDKNLSEHLKRAIVYWNGLCITRKRAQLERQTDLIKLGNSLVAKANIICIEKDKKSVIVYTMKKTYTFTSGLKELKEQLPEYFIYVNRSVIINAKCVVEINQKKTVQLINDKVFDLAKTKAKDIYQQLEFYLKRGI